MNGGTNSMQRKGLTSWQRLWIDYGVAFCALLLIVAVFVITWIIFTNARDSANPTAAAPAVPIPVSREAQIELSGKADPELAQALRAQSVTSEGEESTPSTPPASEAPRLDSKQWSY